MSRRDKNAVMDCFNDPRIGIVVQGNKRVTAAKEEYRYGAG
ncbi:MAG: AraC family transcriptional regulator [Treponema sp.]|nr:AraC family transcriptional regulator [Treponema sp.]